VTSVLKLWRYGGRRERSIGCGHGRANSGAFTGRKIGKRSSATTLGLSFLLADYRLISGVTTRTRKDAAAGWQMALTTDH